MPKPIAEQLQCTEADRAKPDVQSGIEREVDAGEDTITYTTVCAADYPEPPETFEQAAIETYV
jgi:hypothetical protein